MQTVGNNKYLKIRSNRQPYFNIADLVESKMRYSRFSCLSCRPTSESIGELSRDLIKYKSYFTHVSRENNLAYRNLCLYVFSATAKRKNTNSERHNRSAIDISISNRNL